jgi:hypothetical protein
MRGKHGISADRRHEREALETQIADLTRKLGSMSARAERAEASLADEIVRRQAADAALVADVRAAASPELARIADENQRLRDENVARKHMSEKLRKQILDAAEFIERVMVADGATLDQAVERTYEILPWRSHPSSPDRWVSMGGGRSVVSTRGLALREKVIHAAVNGDEEVLRKVRALRAAAEPRSKRA